MPVRARRNRVSRFELTMEREVYLVGAGPPTGDPLALLEAVWREHRRHFEWTYDPPELHATWSWRVFERGESFDAVMAEIRADVELLED